MEEIEKCFHLAWCVVAVAAILFFISWCVGECATFPYFLTTVIAGILILAMCIWFCAQCVKDCIALQKQDRQLRHEKEMQEAKQRYMRDELMVQIIKEGLKDNAKLDESWIELLEKAKFFPEGEQKEDKNLTKKHDKM